MSDEIMKEKPSSKNWVGYHIPAGNAKMILRGLEDGTSPLLPENGVMNPSPVYNARTGYILPATQLIPAQIKMKEQGFGGNIVATGYNLKEAGTQKKPEEKGLWFNYQDKNGNFQAAAYFFPEQTENPSAVKDFAEKNHLKDRMVLRNLSFDVEKPEDYLTAYLAAAKSGLTVNVKPETADAFRKSITEICNNQLKDRISRDPSIPLLHDYLFDSDKKSVELIKDIARNNNIELSKGRKDPDRQPEKEKQQVQEKRRDRSFDVTR